MRRQGPLGKNPYYGTEFKYFIREINEEDSLELRVEVLDEDDNIIRTFSSNESLKSRKININVGYNNIKWDGDVEGFVPPVGVMTPRGSDGYMKSYSVMPGSYSVRFTYGDYTKTSKFKIHSDPRHELSSELIENKESLLKNIHNDIDDIYSSLERLQSAREQILDLQSRFSSEDNYSDINELSKETIKVINGVESSLISPKQKTFQDVINFRNQLDAQLFDLLSKVDRNIPPVTNGELERFEDLHKKWMAIKSDYDKVITSVDRINKLLIEKSVPFISGGGN
tara:strand:- start:398 stop:1246 length:849 start_codon:yes stop_codon:yes gene_type:complete